MYILLMYHLLSTSCQPCHASMHEKKDVGILKSSRCSRSLRGPTPGSRPPHPPPMSSSPGLVVSAKSGTGRTYQTASTCPDTFNSTKRSKLCQEMISPGKHPCLQLSLNHCISYSFPLDTFLPPGIRSCAILLHF